MALVEAGYGTWDQVEAMNPTLKSAIMYARAEQAGGIINWDTGSVSWPKRPGSD